MGPVTVDFNEPYGIAIDDSDNVYVADTGNDRIQKFDPNGDLLTKWGTAGSGDGQFYWPSMIGIDSSGNVYVSDWGNYRIQKFGPNRTFITTWGTDGTSDGQFDGPDGMAIDASGNVYVSDYYNHRIQKFDSNGNFLTKWGTEGSGNGRFSFYPEGVAVDASGNVYVADSENNRIQKFNSNGVFIAKWGTSGFGSGSLPTQLASPLTTWATCTSPSGTTTAFKSSARMELSSSHGAPPARVTVSLMCPLELPLIHLGTSTWRTTGIIASRFSLPTGSRIHPWIIGQPPILK